jgi:hypothetical protein
VNDPNGIQLFLNLAEKDFHAASALSIGLSRFGKHTDPNAVTRAADQLERVAAHANPDDPVIVRVHLPHSPTH